MTSFMISAYPDKKWPDKWIHDDDCAFCKIVAGQKGAYVVYESEEVVAFLDLLPIRPGHTLVVPKSHVPRITDLPVELSRALGEAITKVGDAVTKGMENPNINIVCNQGYAQAVPHVHFHLVPSPLPSTSPTSSDPTPSNNNPSSSKSSHQTSSLPPEIQKAQHKPASFTEIHRSEILNRDELDEEEASIIVERIRSKL